MKLKAIALILIALLSLGLASSCTEDQIAETSSSAATQDDELPPGYQSMAEAPTPSRDQGLTC